MLRAKEGLKAVPSVLDVREGEAEIVEEAQPAPENSSTAAETKAVAAAPLAFRAFCAIIVRFFQRLFGKSEETKFDLTHRLHHPKWQKEST